MGLFKGHFNSLLVSTDTHWKAFGIPPSCNILIFAFLRILTTYQVTVTVILRWHIPWLAVAGFASAACCLNPTGLRFIAFSYCPPLLRCTPSFFVLTLWLNTPQPYFLVHVDCTMNAQPRTKQELTVKIHMLWTWTILPNMKTHR